ncbi:phosphate acyltransferase [Natranaerofaba carboxydovora]|uniref:phosphate acyltransferase n=1 Tax=Natranaerofaba carboxydovora TaxID=2742683 RepID=UPI001F12927B|nr:phosphate acyltransferase [Natranaerofaba carboxydovora]UMZ72515.1 Phosphate acetyltransferase [Natranaerofaba carboxydovora]
MRKLVSFEDFLEEASELPPLKTALLAPENEEVVTGVKRAVLNKIIEPVFIGNKDKIQLAAQKINFDISKFKIHEIEERMEIARKGIELYYKGEVSLACKGQIPTAYIYKAIIRKEKELQLNNRIAVYSVWDLKNPEQLVLLTDTGVNIYPDWQAKTEVLKKAVNFMKSLGYKDLKVLALSAAREINKEVSSMNDIEKIKEVFDREQVPCRFKHGKNLQPFLDTTSQDSFPDIILVPNLETGNITVKLDFLLDIERYSAVISSKGPVIVPSRSDNAEKIYRQLGFGAVISNRLHRQQESSKRSEVY